MPTSRARISRIRRFIYLSWGSVDDAREFTLFRRAKLWLDAIPPKVIDGDDQLLMRPALDFYGCANVRLGVTHHV